jgi:hypothetical protein
MIWQSKKGRNVLFFIALTQYVNIINSQIMRANNLMNGTTTLLEICLCFRHAKSWYIDRHICK